MGDGPMGLLEELGARTTRCPSSRLPAFSGDDARETARARAEPSMDSISAMQ